jgi:hypothetical protein
MSNFPSVPRVPGRMARKQKFITMTLARKYGRGSMFEEDPIPSAQLVLDFTG